MVAVEMDGPCDFPEFQFKEMKKEVLACIEQRDSTTGVEMIENVFSLFPGSDMDRKGAVDQAFRDTVIEYILIASEKRGGDEKAAINGEEAANHASKNGEDSEMIAKYEDLITFVILHAKEKLCTNNLPILLLNDIFDSSTLLDCEKLFVFVERNVNIWTSEPFFTAGKNHLLRMCNDILRRLSKSQNTIFCGRIQLFLAQLFPVEEKSAVNLNSNFDLTNTTLYKKSPSDFDLMSGMEEEGELPSVQPVVDYNLYIKFWSLQDFFRNPPQCYTPVGWKTFKLHMMEVLNVFDSHRIEYNVKKKAAYEFKVDNKLFAKYLTNEKLLNLQLNDSNFRRYFLVQTLILFQYLTGDLKKFKNPTQVLTDTQTQWVTEMSDKVYSIIGDTPPNGKKFASSVQHILNREENWINWKNCGCGSFAKFPPALLEEMGELPKEDTRKKSRGVKRSVGEEYLSNRSKKANLGNTELTRLWNLCPDNLKACKAENRLNFLPQLDTFFEEAIEQADPEAGIEEEYKVVNDSSFQWRALRLLAHRSHHFFTPSQTPFKALPEYLQSVIENISKDFQKPTEIKVEPVIKEEAVEPLTTV